MSHAYGMLSGARASLRRKKKKGKLTFKSSEMNMEALPAASKSDSEWEFPREKLDGLAEIGHGQFGIVYIGYATGIIPGEKRTRVAVKTLSVDGEDDFEAEVKIMKAIDGPHNVVRLLGVCRDKAPYYMIMEYMSRGDLKSVLKATIPTEKEPNSIITKKRIVQLGADIAEGMEYLASVHIVHRDLAARNCLVNDEYAAKVGDFGLTRKTYSRDYYRMKGSAPLPIRWMALESLNDGVFSTMSDVWSFGVLLWEIASFGRLPYGHLDNQEILDEISEGFRLPAPGPCPDGFYDVMLQCWKGNPKSRKDFTYCKNTLEALAASTPDEPITELMLLMEGETSLPSDDDDDDDDVTAGYDQRDVAGQGFGNYGLPSGGKGGTYENPIPVVRRPGAGAGYDADSVATWVGKVTGTTVSSADLHGALRSGEVLCKLINRLQPGSVSTVHSSASALRQMENIGNFIESMQVYGVPAEESFDVGDLFDDDDMMRVVMSLATLKQLADEKAQ